MGNLKSSQQFPNSSQEFRDFYQSQPSTSKILKKPHFAETTDLIDSVYDFYNVLGEGSLGKTRYAVLKSDPDSKFAVKCIDKEKLSKDENFYKTDAEMLLAFDHPNIVKYYEVYEVPKKIYLVMDCCENGDLLTRMEEMLVIPEDYAKHVMLKAFSAIQYLHKMGIAHRDIKPQNFLFYGPPENEELKLTDFTLAKVFGRLPNQKMHSCVGSILFAAPEVMKGDPYNEKCDLWGMGLILYMFLCQDYPFPHNNTESLLKGITKCKFSMKGPKWDFISDEAKDLVKHLIEKSPEKRYCASQVLAHPWFQRLPSPSKRLITEENFGKDVEVTRILSKEDMKTFSVTNLPFSQLRSLLSICEINDKNSTGFLPVEVFRKCVIEFDPKLTKEEVDKLIAGVKVEKDSGLVNYSDFISEVAERKKGNQSDRLFTENEFGDEDSSMIALNPNDLSLLLHKPDTYSRVGM